MFELSFNNVKKYLDATLVLEDITFNIYDGEKVGIVGANGSGKSTILKLMSGIYSMTRDDEGYIIMPRKASVAYLEQVPKYPENMKVIDVLNIAFEELKIIEQDMKTLEYKMKLLKGEELERTLQQYSAVQHSYEVKGGYDIEEKLSKVCNGLNFGKEFLEKDFDILSGGEKTTVILGKILLQNPDILLLDEPTNHLDMAAVEWLEGYLKSYKGIVIVVSHDRYFLDNVVTKIVEVEDGVCETYNGNYSSYVKQKEENMLLQFQAFKEQQKKIAAMEKAIKDLRDWAIRADNNKFFKRAASMQKQLDKMDRISKPKLERTNMKLNFKEADRSGKEVIKAEKLCKSYEEKQLLKNADLLVLFQERVALLGSNGCGKTTFLRMLLGEEVPDSGVSKVGESVKVAYLPQNIKFKNEEATVLDVFREDISILEGKAREYLSKFMFFGGTVFKKVKHLSGGERIRLKLSKLLYEDVNLLILDEPTNHLDIDSIETLEESLENFHGTIFFISHDRYFVNKMADRIVEIDEAKFKSYYGNYDYYKSEKEKFKVQVVEEKVKKEKIKTVKPVDINKKILAKIQKLEEEITEFELCIQQIEEQMLSQGTDYDKLNDLCKEKEEMEKNLESAMEKWEKYNEELDKSS
ncbi:ribosomal protection-like ABC-F family protein [Inconstantimicrobium mannanitabidum]|uniref:ABC transporter ATP-binding protein n=1 Tax=Inconstantimicrobium mannanitabidum TaxID=1604901 RepID=A0ACB5REA5_9CLOT|nr:ABC-F type ribosomal protection protein [Clostridium sp. TW13]GKX67096.1 ABC transporter ATP-binding protein [Clostridium sp. TW13]